MEQKWWHNKIAYQIYPKSFLDTNGDGIGDLRGVISKLDYLKGLGVDIIWLSPVYQSPFVDQGYDISDYYTIAEEFGTMADFEELLRETGRREMFIVMDLVINHCSDQHVWFQKALEDPYGKYADYFYFRKGKDGEPPSNYRSYFGGPAWEPVKGTELYYLHAFAKEQPDLNWENEEVREELYRMVNWWLEKGLVGFRVDAIINIKKDLQFPSFPADAEDGLVHYTRMIETVEGIGGMLADLNKNTFARHDAFTVAEVFNMKEEELEEFIGEAGHFSTMFDFSGEVLTKGEHGWYDAPKLEFQVWRDTMLKELKKIESFGFYSNIIENHDEPRGASRYLPEHVRNPDGAKMLGTVSILLRGIPFIYQGQEIGMTNCRRESIDEYDDISTHDEYKRAMEAGFTEAEALELCYHRSRDNARTPMQWSSEACAGFTSGTPWLKVNSEYDQINVAAQEADEQSVLNYYRKLTTFRKSSEYQEVLTYGTCIQRFQEEPWVFAYERELGDKKILVAGNFGEEEVLLKVEGSDRMALLGNMEGQSGVQKGRLKLKSGEVAVV